MFIHRHRLWWIGALLLASACASAAARPTAAAVPVTSPTAPITRTLLDHYDLPSTPGWESRLYLIEYAPGVVAPIHHHPVEGLGYVLSGSFESKFQGAAPVVVHAGQSFRERVTVPHLLFRNISDAEPLRFMLAFVVQKDAPVLETP
jgi:quercetin dioxygenase-like cupin family protein